MARVAVIIPACNSAATVALAIDSALAQTCNSIEVIVVDDGSTDATPEIAAGYGDRIKLVRQRNRGPSIARNNGLGAAGPSEYVAFLDADDVWMPNVVESLVGALDAAPLSMLAFCDLIPIDSQGSVLEYSFIDYADAHAPTMEEMLSRWWPILTSAVLMRRTAFENVGGFSEEFDLPGFEDPFLWLLMREQGSFEYIDQPMVIYRTTPPLDRMMKYGKGFKTFARLVIERYGAAGMRLVEQTGGRYGEVWTYHGLLALREGNKLLARRAFECALLYGDDRARKRLRGRWLRTFLPVGLARALSGGFVHRADRIEEYDSFFRI